MAMHSALLSKDTNAKEAIINSSSDAPVILYTDHLVYGKGNYLFMKRSHKVGVIMELDGNNRIVDFSKTHSIPKPVDVPNYPLKDYFSNVGLYYDNSFNISYDDILGLDLHEVKRMLPFNKGAARWYMRNSLGITKCPINIDEHPILRLLKKLYVQEVYNIDYGKLLNKLVKILTDFDLHSNTEVVADVIAHTVHNISADSIVNSNMFTGALRKKYNITSIHTLIDILREAEFSRTKFEDILNSIPDENKNSPDIDFAVEYIDL
jgi:hypothetical protein